MMSTPAPHEVIEYILPYLATAGSYSARVQNGVAVHDAKDGDTPFHHALSDADLSIQAFLEVVLLARFPNLHFFSEEQEHSLNKKYFSAESSLEILLDPVDGTRSYIDKRDRYQIIVTLHDEQQITGAICYQPRRDRCYVASKGNGAFELTHSEAANRSLGRRLSLIDATGPALVFNSPSLSKRLEGVIETKDLAETYASHPGVYDSTDIIVGKASAVVHETCQAIDGGAMGFIATEAGAIMTDFQGNQPCNFRTDAKRVLSDILVSANWAVHDKILAALRK
jgi:fructose-1,6-bisphosphatase/inositol monophosphatase family enzyme